MITGAVSPEREAIVRLTVRGPGGNEYECDAVLDTGFNGWLTLPNEVISDLGLPWKEVGEGVLADGSEILFDIYEATVVWDGHPLTISVDEADADSLLGMSLMYGYELLLPVLDGATLTLKKM